MDEFDTVLSRRLARRSDTPLAVAFSGGADSLALLLAVKGWADDVGRAVIALTIDHGLQPASRDWAHWCENRARRLGVAHRAMAWRGDKPSTGIPARARQARHRLLAEASREAGARVLLMGHTLDDILEARLMRAAGGSVGEPREWGPSPVWPEGRGVFLLRPLLGIRREALRRRLRGFGETWIDDPANTDQASARARARLEIGHRSLASPPAMAVVREPAGRAGGPELFKRATVHRGGDIELDLGGLSVEDRRRLIGPALVCAGGGDRPPRRAALDRLMARLRQDGGVATLAGARIQWRADQIQAVRETRPAPPRDLGPSQDVSVRGIVEERLAAALGAIGDEAAADAWRQADGHTKSLETTKDRTVQ